MAILFLRHTSSEEEEEGGFFRPPKGEQNIFFVPGKFASPGAEGNHEFLMTQQL